jgi:hypothetical protein
LGEEILEMKKHGAVLLGAVLTILATAPASAAEFGFNGVDLHGGVNLPSDWDTGITAGVSVNIGELVDGLYLYPAVFYSRAEESASFSFLGTTFEEDLEVTNLALGAEVRYFLNGEPTGWYFGGGPYLNMLTFEAGVRVGAGDRVQVIEVEDDSVGGMGVAGYRTRMGERFSLGLEARYNVVTDFDNGQILLVIGF